MELNNPAMQVSIENAFETTIVFDAITPLAYTDLDLSAWVGARKALVVLTLEHRAVVQATYLMRPNGSGGYYWPNSMDVSGGAMSNGHLSRCFIITDANGIVEWRSNQNLAARIYLEAFIHE